MAVIFRCKQVNLLVFHYWVEWKIIILININTLFYFFRILDALQNINKKLDEQTKQMAAVKLSIDKMSYAPKRESSINVNTNYQTILYVAIGLIIQSILTWFLSKK